PGAPPAALADPLRRRSNAPHLRAGRPRSILLVTGWGRNRLLRQPSTRPRFERQYGPVGIDTGYRPDPPPAPGRGMGADAKLVTGRPEHRLSLHAGPDRGKQYRALDRECPRERHSTPGCPGRAGTDLPGMGHRRTTQ